MVPHGAPSGVTAPVAAPAPSGATAALSARGIPPGVIAAVVAALAVRVAFVLATPHYRLVNDPADYQRIAVSLATGHGFGPSGAAGAGPSAFRPPLYPGFLAVLHLLGGHVETARLAQAVAGAVSVALLGVLATQLLGRRVATAACWIAALYVPLILDGAALLSESIAVPLELATVCAALHLRHARRRGVWLVAIGAAAGLGILNRPNTALLLVPLGLLVAPVAGPRRAVASVAIVLAVAGAATVPWLVRDERAFHRFVPLTTQTGLVMAGTYNPVSATDRHHPAAFRPANLVPSYVASLRAEPVVGEVAIEHRLRSLSLAYIDHHPLYPLWVAGWNTIRLFDLTGPAWARLAAAAIGFGPLLADTALYVYYVVGVAALLGIAFGRPSRVPPAVWLVPVAVVVSTVFLQGETRMRAGVEPFVILLAAMAVERASSLVGGR